MMEEFSPSLPGEMSPGILAWVDGGRIMYANSSICTWLEYDPEEIKGLTFKDGMGTEYLHLHQVLHPIAGIDLLSKQLSAFMNPEQHACYITNTVLLRKSRSPVDVTCIVLNLVEPLQRNIGISIGLFMLNQPSLM